MTTDSPDSLDEMESTDETAPGDATESNGADAPSAQTASDDGGELPDDDRDVFAELLAACKETFVAVLDDLSESTSDDAATVDDSTDDQATDPATSANDGGDDS